LCEVADGTSDDAVAALAAADKTQASWAAVPPRRRGEILRRAYELLMERKEWFALLITLEKGKSLAESRAEVEYGANYLRWFGEEAVRFGQGGCGQWCLWCRLDDHAAARRHRRADLAGRHGQRRVPRRDQQTGPDRLPGDQHAGRAVLTDLPAAVDPELLPRACSLPIPAVRGSEAPTRTL
jgi:hypothetical protein